MYLHQYHTFEEARLRLQTFLEDVSNAKRLHSLLDYVLPDEFELKYSMGSCLGGLGFLGALHNINCQKNCHSTSHKERCTCSIKARRRCRGNARWVENWSPPFGIKNVSGQARRGLRRSLLRVDSNKRGNK